MKILVVCQHYFPEPFRLPDICEALVKEGHEVLVVTGIPNYPEGKIYRTYRWRKKRDETINGVRVHRCFTIGRRKNSFFRVLNYYSYAWFSSRYAARLKEHFDVLLVNQLSPVMMANAALAYQKKHNTKMVLYCLDLWPESLTLGGIKKGSAIYNHYHKVSDKIYAKADRILVSSKDFATYFRDEFGIDGTEYLPQYAETIFTGEKCRKEPGDTVDLMFAGNVGMAQGVETIIQAAEKTKDITNLYWHIVGDGSGLEQIRQYANSLELSNVIFHGRQPLEEIPNYFSMADAMLVTMKKNDVISKTLPGKVQAYMAAGKPILGAIDGEAAWVIRNSGCGMCCAAEDAEGLAAIAREFVAGTDRNSYGEAALLYYEKMFSKDMFMKKLTEVLSEVSTSESDTVKTRDSEMLP